MSRTEAPSQTEKKEDVAEQNGAIAYLGDRVGEEGNLVEYGKVVKEQPGLPGRQPMRLT